MRIDSVVMTYVRQQRCWQNSICYKYKCLMFICMYRGIRKCTGQHHPDRFIRLLFSINSEMPIPLSVSYIQAPDVVFNTRSAHHGIGKYRTRPKEVLNCTKRTISSPPLYRLISAVTQYHHLVTLEIFPHTEQDYQTSTSSGLDLCPRALPEFPGP